MSISNSGIPRRIHFLTFIGDSFRRYIKLKTLQNGKFPATGYSFDFVVITDGQINYLYSKFNIIPVDIGHGVYIPIEIEKDALRKAGVYRYELRATKEGSRQSWLTGRFVVSKYADRDKLEQDIVIIDTSGLKVSLTLLIASPSGSDVEPVESDIFISSDIWDNSTLY